MSGWIDDVVVLKPDRDREREGKKERERKLGPAPTTTRRLKRSTRGQHTGSSPLRVEDQSSEGTNVKIPFLFFFGAAQSKY